MARGPEGEAPRPAHAPTEPRRGGLGADLRFLVGLWRAGLQSAMAFRASFLTQVVGMALNNAMYLAFWVVLFERFPAVGSWGLRDVVLLFGVVAAAFGVAVVLFGNVLRLGDAITGGALDAWLTLPRPVLTSLLASRMATSGLGDVATGLVCFALSGQRSPEAAARFVVAVAASATIFLAFMVLVQSLAFWIGSATLLRQTAFNAVLTFATYPLALFDGSAKFVLLTVVPAGIIGTVSAEFVRRFAWLTLGQLVVAALVLAALAAVAFRTGLARYASGSVVLALE